ncbi:MAG TPA: histidine kinase [Candidatus Binataceae bacterium]|nr:histidine kinase [Candidatus Binataceae bacterium]
MKTFTSSDLDLNVARARIALSLLAMLTLYVDPSLGGLFRLETYPLITLLAHLAYSLATFAAVRLHLRIKRLAQVTTGLDLLFATAVALLAEGSTSPSYTFFIFAIVAVAFRSGFESTVSVTMCSVILYLTVIGLVDGLHSPYMMRPVYLAIAGYLIGFFAQERAKFEARVRELETRTERQTIARSLHDGYVQALAGVNLRLEACRALLAGSRPAEAAVELKELQVGVAREYDEVRAYLRTLAEIDNKIAHAAVGAGSETTFSVQLSFAARGVVVEQVFQIVLEGMRNAWRHGQARSVIADVREDNEFIRIAIDDDGIGFRQSDRPPWSIASRVAESGGQLRITNHDRRGAHLEVEMPNN